MDDAISTARSARALLERIGARIPGFRGYLERELRREVDQLLRAQLVERLDAARERVASCTRSLGLGAASALTRLAGIDKSLDAVANAMRHAGSGYGGLFDAVKVREEQLEAFYRRDLELVEQVDAVGAAAARLADGDDAIARLEAAIASVRERLDARDAVVKSVFS
jgi:hypothetical protein